MGQYNKSIFDGLSPVWQRLTATGTFESSIWSTPSLQQSKLMPFSLFFSLQPFCPATFDAHCNANRHIKDYNAAPTTSKPTSPSAKYVMSCRQQLYHKPYVPAWWMAIPCETNNTSGLICIYLHVTNNCLRDRKNGNRMRHLITFHRAGPFLSEWQLTRPVGVKNDIEKYCIYLAGYTGDITDMGCYVVGAARA